MNAYPGTINNCIETTMAKSSQQLAPRSIEIFSGELLDRAVPDTTVDLNQMYN